MTAALQPWTPPQPLVKTRQPIESLRVWYEYDRALRLNPKILQRDDGKAKHYRHEIVRIDAACNRERFNLHLLVPRSGAGRRETVLFVPGAGAWYGKSYDDHSCLEWGLIMELVETGRIVCHPVYKGSLERGDGALPQGESIRDRDLWLAAAKDGMRAVDYLTTREDVDSERLIYVGCSFGAFWAPVLLAMEPRFKAAVLLQGGYWWGPIRPALDPYQFTPYVHQPVLMITGRYDFTFPLETSQLRMFDDLGTADKRHILLECGHGVPFKQAVEMADQWLRERLGSPRHVGRSEGATRTGARRDAAPLLGGDLRN